MDGVVASGRGTLVTWTVVHQAPEQFSVPYVLAWVQLEDVPVGVVGRFHGAPGPWLEGLRAGATLRLTEQEHDSGPSAIWMELDDGA